MRNRKLTILFTALALVLAACGTDAEAVPARTAAVRHVT